MHFRHATFVQWAIWLKIHVWFRHRKLRFLLRPPNTNLFLIKRNTLRLSTNNTNIMTPCAQFQMSVSIKYGLSGDKKYEIPSIIHVTPITIDNRTYKRKLKNVKRKKKTKLFTRMRFHLKIHLFSTYFSLSRFNLRWCRALSLCTITRLISFWSEKICSTVNIKNITLIAQTIQSGK